ncbi:MAG: hypothetical protein QXP25_04415, partial [Thermoplasmatales archaeon]
LAGETAVEAKKRNDFSASSLSLYRTKLEETYVLKDLRTFKDIRKVTGNKNMYTVYPKMLEGILLEMLWERGQPKKKIREILSSCAADLKMSRLKTVTDFYYMYRRM